MQVSILGCGWLGLPLAKALIGEGYTVKGSTTTPAKLNLLKEEGVEPFLISLYEDRPEGDIQEFLAASDILIIDVPPKTKSGESYPGKIKTLIPYIEDAGIKKVLFVSSTSVYGDDNSIVTERTIPNPDTDSGKQLVETEKLLQKNQNFKTTILRFGGLIADDRHPVYHLAGRQNIANPDAAINLIHQDDCIGIIKAIIDKEAWGAVFNSVAPYHPTRKEYYTAKAEELGLELPTFNATDLSTGKIVNAQQATTQLNYRFKVNI